MTDKMMPQASGEAKSSGKPKAALRKLIFLTGFANTGKDTTFELIKKISIEPVIRVSFADALKAECYPKMEIDPKEYTPETDDREWKDAHRDEIIRYGEGQKHIHGMYYWVQRALDPVLFKKDFSKLKESEYPHIVVTDCRRTEEIMWFKEFKMYGEPEYRAIYDPLMFVVHREGAEKTDKDYLSHVALQYAAETRVFSKMIKNYETVAKLEQQIKDIYAVDIR
jgi:hypothetical protein